MSDETPTPPPEMAVPDENFLAVACKYAPDGEPERTNEELIRHISDHLASNLSGMVARFGINKCVLYNKSFTLKLELSPSSVVIEDFLKEQSHDKD